MSNNRLQTKFGWILMVLCLALGYASGVRADLVEADALIVQGRYEAALQSLKTVPDSVSENAILQRQGLIALGLGRNDLAEQIFERLSLLDLDDPEVTTGLAYALFAQGKMREGMAQMRQAVRRFPNHAGTIAMMARFEDRTGRTTEALNRLRQARTRLGDAPELVEAVADIQAGRTPQMARSRAETLPTAPVAPIAPAVPLNPSPVVQPVAPPVAPAKPQPMQPVNPSVHAPAVAPVAASAASAPPARTALPRVEPQFDPLMVPKDSNIVSGSGFVIDQGRHVVTNAHVVSDTQTLQVRNGLGKVRQARVVALHAAEDLAILALDTPYPAEWSLSRQQIAEPAPGRACVVLGYPLSDMLGAKWPSLTTGHVSRTQGADPNLMEITAAINSGNSGGPVMDHKGRIIGVVVAKLDKLQFAQEHGDLPQDVNFAVRPGLLQKALAKIAVPDEPVRPLGEMDAEALYEYMLPSVVLIVGTENEKGRAKK